MDSSSSFLTTTSLDQRKPSLVSRKPIKKQKKKTTTSTSSTNKHIKVRYISNPMRVETCASKFRELVQELTGQDAVDLQPDPFDISPSPVSDHSPSPPAENLAPPRVLYQEPLDDRVGGCYEPLDGEEMFLPQMSAGFSGFFSSNGFYNANDFASIDSM